MNGKANLEVASKELEDPKEIAREMLKAEKPMKAVIEGTRLNKTLEDTKVTRKILKANEPIEAEEGVGGGPRKS